MDWVEFLMKGFSESPVKWVVVFNIKVYELNPASTFC